VFRFVVYCIECCDFSSFISILQAFYTNLAKWRLLLSFHHRRFLGGPFCVARQFDWLGAAAA